MARSRSSLLFNLFRNHAGMMMGGGADLTIFTDSFIRADGLVGGQWVGSGALSILSNIAYITPVEGNEILTDPDLEGTYTAGKVATLTKNGSPTLSESAVVHKGSKSQDFTATAAVNFLRFASFAGVDGTHYKFSYHGRRISGTTGGAKASFSQASGYNPTLAAYLMNGNYLRYEATSRAEGAGSYTPYAVIDYGAATWDDVVIDDFSCVPLIYGSLFKMVKSRISNVKVTAKIYYPNYPLRAGLIICADSPTNPQNGLIVWLDKQAFRIEKLLNGVFSTLSTTTTLTVADWGEVMITFDGSNVNAYYNGTLKGGPVAVSDAGIINNKYHGLYSLSADVKFASFGFAPVANTITLNERNTQTVISDTTFNAFGGCIKSGARLIGVYRKGTSHGADNGVIVQRISTDNGVTWGAEVTIATDETYDCRDASLTLLSTGNLILIYNRYNTTGSHIDIKCKISTDNGDTWGAEIAVTTGATAWSVGASPVIEDSTGRLLLAYYCKDTGNTKDSSRLVISTDGGGTWGGDVIIANGETASKNYQEPELVKLVGTHILCLIRNSTDAYIASSHSTDDGATWGAVANLFIASSVPHTEVMASGRVVCTCRNGTNGFRLFSSPDGTIWYPIYYSVDGSAYTCDYATPIDLGDGLIGVWYSMEISASKADMFWATIPESFLAQS